MAAVTRVLRSAARRSTGPRDRAGAAAAPVVDPVEVAIVEEAKANPTDGYRMVWAFAAAARRAVNRKRVLRVMRERKLIQRRGRSSGAGGPACSGSSGRGSCGSWT